MKWYKIEFLRKDLNNRNPLYKIFISYAVKPNNIESYEKRTSDKIIVILKANNEYFEISEGIRFHLFAEINTPSEDYLKQFKKIS
jgi:hypothetical protein